MERRMAAGLLLVAMMVAAVGGQSMMVCTIEMIASFTPCVSFVTARTNSSLVPSATCCTAIGRLLETGTNCACLLLTGSIPFGLPFNPGMAYTLPRLCNTTTVDLFTCKAPPTYIAPTAPVLPPPVKASPPPTTPSLPPFTIPSSGVSIPISTALLAVASSLLLALV